MEDVKQAAADACRAVSAQASALELLQADDAAHRWCCPQYSQAMAIGPPPPPPPPFPGSCPPPVNNIKPPPLGFSHHPCNPLSCPRVRAVKRSDTVDCGMDGWIDEGCIPRCFSVGSRPRVPLQPCLCCEFFRHKVHERLASLEGCALLHAREKEPNTWILPSEDDLGTSKQSSGNRSAEVPSVRSVYFQLSRFSSLTPRKPVPFVLHAAYPRAPFHSSFILTAVLGMGTGNPEAKGPPVPAQTRAPSVLIPLQRSPNGQRHLKPLPLVLPVQKACQVAFTTGMM